MKRFYKDASVVAAEGEFNVALDGRNIRTPVKAVLTAPTRALADAIAGEWNAQGDEIDVDSMSMMKFASTAIDRVRPRRDAVTKEISGFAQTDLLCYRAAHPADLVLMQADAWQPLLDWCATELGARLIVTEGVIPVQQDDEALSAVKDAVAAHDDFAMAALHELTTLSGSVIIALAVTAGRLEAPGAADASQVDDSFQAEKWGFDKDAADVLASRRKGIEGAAAYYALLQA
ncbi:MAG: ATPase [Alphaproteobacteria bacterium]|nr:ATPase [Alphaproteobacteria bacterium]